MTDSERSVQHATQAFRVRIGAAPATVTTDLPFTFPEQRVTGRAGGLTSFRLQAASNGTSPYTYELGTGTVQPAVFVDAIGAFSSRALSGTVNLARVKAIAARGTHAKALTTNSSGNTVVCDINLSTGALSNPVVVSIPFTDIHDIGVSPDGEVWFLTYDLSYHNSIREWVYTLYLQKGASGTRRTIGGWTIDQRARPAVYGSLAVRDNTTASVYGRRRNSGQLYIVDITTGTATESFAALRQNLSTLKIAYSELDHRVYSYSSGVFYAHSGRTEGANVLLTAFTIAGNMLYGVRNSRLYTAPLFGTYDTSTLPDIITVAPTTQTNRARWGNRWWRRGVSGSLSGTLDSNILAITSKHIAFKTTTPSGKRPAAVVVHGIRHVLNTTVTSRVGGLVAGSYNTKAFQIDLLDQASWGDVIIVYEDGTASAMRQAVAGRRETFENSQLPQGISFSPTTRTIEVSSSVAAGEYMLAARATDSASPAHTAVALVTITLTPAPVLVLPAISDVAFTAGTAAYTQVLPVAAGGDGTTIDYIADIPNTNNGKITFNSATRTLTVAADTAAGTYSVSYEASDANNTATRTFNIVVSYNITLATPNAITVADDASRNVVLPAASGATIGVSYKLEQVHQGTPRNLANLNGVGFTASTRTVEVDGPTSTPGTYTLRYTAAVGGVSVFKDFTLTITGATQLALPTVDNKTLVNNNVTNFVLPAATGGDLTPTQYSVTHDMGANASFNAGTRTLQILAGIPTGVYNVTYRARDNAYNVTRTFTVTVDSPPLAYPTTSYTRVGGTVHSIVIPAATGGTLPYRYTIASLPSGFTFNTTTRELRIANDASVGTNRLRLTVRDSGAARVKSASFTITVIVTPPLTLGTPQAIRWVKRETDFERQMLAGRGRSATLCVSNGEPANGYDLQPFDQTPYNNTGYSKRFIHAPLPSHGFCSQHTS